MTRRRLLVLGVLAGTALMVPALGETHASLVKSVPARRATLAHPPARVQLSFNERLEPAYSSVSVWDAKGLQVDRRQVTVDPEDPKLVSVELPALGPGVYTVRFRVLSVDGHVVESSFPFTITSGAGTR